MVDWSKRIHRYRKYPAISSEVVAMQHRNTVTRVLPATGRVRRIWPSQSSWCSSRCQTDSPIGRAIWDRKEIESAGNNRRKRLEREMECEGRSRILDTLADSGPHADQPARIAIPRSPEGTRHKKKARRNHRRAFRNLNSPDTRGWKASAQDPFHCCHH